MRLQLQNYCPQNKTTEVIYVFSYPNILFLFLLWKMLLLHLSFLFPSHQLFYLPSAHELLVNIILQIFSSVCLTAVLKATLSFLGWTFFSYPAPSEALWTLGCL